MAEERGIGVILSKANLTKAAIIEQIRRVVDSDK